MTDSGSFDSGDLIYGADLYNLAALIATKCAAANVTGLSYALATYTAGSTISAVHSNDLIAAYQRCWNASSNKPGTLQSAIAQGGTIYGALYQNMWTQLNSMVFNAYSYHRVVFDTSAYGTQVECGELEFYESNVLIPQANGTAIGDMTANSGLAAAFDGALENYASDCAVKLSPTGWVGKYWGSGVRHVVNKIVVSGSGNGGYCGSGDGAVVLTLQGSNDGSTWTTLQSWSFTDAQGHCQQTLTV